MAKYTTTIKTICESINDTINSEGIPSTYANIDTLISGARSYIFDFTYPLWSDNHAAEYPNYKAYFESKILKRYYMREIGFETVAQFKLQLCNKLNEIMPYYNQLFESELLDFEVFENVDMTNTSQKEDTGTDGHTRENTSTTTDTSTTNTVTDGTSNTVRTPDLEEDTTIKNLDTPQGTVSNLTDNGYLTNASKEHSEQTGTDTTNNTHEDETNTTFNGTSNTTSNESYEATNTFNSDTSDTSKGKNSSETYSEMLNKYRGTFLNIEKDILDELNELFMLVY